MGRRKRKWVTVLMKKYSGWPSDLRWLLRARRGLNIFVYCLSNGRIMHFRLSIFSGELSKAFPNMNNEKCAIGGDFWSSVCKLWVLYAALTAIGASFSKLIPKKPMAVVCAGLHHRLRLSVVTRDVGYAKHGDHENGWGCSKSVNWDQ